jgi:hypothetical protein
LRVLLSARAGVRGGGGPPLHWLQGGVALLALLLVVAGLVRQAGVAGEPTVTGQGVWKVLGGAAFFSPVGLAADRFGNLYVVDAASFHIYKLAPDGTLLATFGTRGSAPGQFDRPTAIALDPIGNLYVADTANSRIEKLSSTGVPLGTWGTFGSGPGQFNAPRGVAVDREDYVYVADTGNDRVTKLSPLGQTVAIWGRTGRGLGEFTRITASRSSRRAGRPWRSGACTGQAMVSSTTRARWSSTCMATCTSPTASTIASRSCLRLACR